MKDEIDIVGISRVSAVVGDHWLCLVEDEMPMIGGRSSLVQQCCMCKKVRSAVGDFEHIDCIEPPKEFLDLSPLKKTNGSRITDLNTGVFFAVIGCGQVRIVSQALDPVFGDLRIVARDASGGGFSFPPAGLPVKCLIRQQELEMLYGEYNRLLESSFQSGTDLYHSLKRMVDICADLLELNGVDPRHMFS